MHSIRQKIWLQYAITYLIVLAVPFFSFSMFFRHYLSGAEERAVHEDMQLVLGKIQTDFDQRVEQMIAISVQLSVIRDFQTTSLNQYSYAVWQNIERALMSYNATSLFFSDILYYNRALPDTVFSTRGTYGIVYFRSFLDPESGEWMRLNQMNDKQLSGWIPSERISTSKAAQEPILLYAHRLGNVEGGYLLFEMKAGDIYRTLLSSTPSDSEVYLLLDDIFLYPFSVERLNAQISLPAGEEVVSENGFYRYALTSPSTGISYLYRMKNDGLKPVLQAALSAYMIISALVSIVCFLAIILASRIHARPIEQLVSLTDGIAPDSANGIARVQSAMQHLRSRSQELDESIRQTMREHALIRLVRGKYYSEDDARESMKHLDMSFTQPYHVVMLFLCDRGFEERDLYTQVLMRIFQRREVYGFTYAERSAYVMIVGVEEMDVSALAKELTDIVALPEMESVNPRFAVGGSFSVLTGAQESFMQALSASRGKAASAVNIFHASDSDDLFYPREELQALKGALVCQDRNRTALLYDVLITLLKRYNHLFLYSVSLLSEMIAMYRDVLAAREISATGREIEPFRWSESQSVNDVDDMFETLTELHETALRLMTEKEALESKPEMTRIANYISACDDIESLTVGWIADRFGINISSLSHRFKEQIGCNISDYILSRKMNHACIKLRTTEDTVVEIACQVGYSQYTSFVRQFKKQKGMTPSEYRDTWRKGRAAADTSPNIEDL